MSEFIGVRLDYETFVMLETIRYYKSGYSLQDSIKIAEQEAK